MSAGCYTSDRGSPLAFRIAVLARLASTVLLAQSWRADNAQLCFVRPENNGSMNLLQSWVRISDYEVPLIGGQSACLFVHPGRANLNVTSTVPYRPESKDPEACKSKGLDLRLAAGEMRTFFVWPATKGSTYVCGWRIEPAQPEPKSNKTSP